MSDKEVAELRQRRTQGVMIRELMQTYGLSKSSVYRLLSQG
jgi:predicted DNA-binding transcriptional regulator AlpA